MKQLFCCLLRACPVCTAGLTVQVLQMFPAPQAISVHQVQHGCIAALRGMPQPAATCWTEEVLLWDSVVTMCCPNLSAHHRPLPVALRSAEPEKHCDSVSLVKAFHMSSACDRIGLISLQISLPTGLLQPYLRQQQMLSRCQSERSDLPNET